MKLKTDLEINPGLAIVSDDNACDSDKLHEL